MYSCVIVVAWCLVQIHKIISLLSHLLAHIDGQAEALLLSSLHSCLWNVFTLLNDLFVFVFIDTVLYSLWLFCACERNAIIFELAGYDDANSLLRDSSGWAAYSGLSKEWIRAGHSPNHQSTQGDTSLWFGTNSEDVQPGNRWNYPNMVHCAGCERPILDRFLLNVLDRPWHIKCVQCCDCKCNLTEKCFSREGRLYCKNDFFR